MYRACPQIDQSDMMARMGHYRCCLIVLILSLVLTLSTSEDLKIRPPSHFENVQLPNQILNSLNNVDFALKHILPGRLEDFIKSTLALNLTDQLFMNVSSEECITHTSYIITRLTQWITTQTPPDTFIMQMVDSWGKLPSGILNGNIFTPGDFQECVQAHSDVSKTGGLDIKGSYCSVYVLPAGSVERKGSDPTGALKSVEHDFGKPVTVEDLLAVLAQPSSVPLLPGLGTCFPQSCSTEDVQQFVENAIRLAGLDKLIDVRLLSCVQNDKPRFDSATIAMITVLAVIIAACITSTVIDVLIFNGYIKTKPGTGLKILLSFSFYTNMKKWADTSTGPDNLGCIHGLRFGSTVWIILVHSWLMFISKVPWNGVDAKLMYKQSWTMMIVLNGTVAVDTFFLIGGALVAYNMLRELEKTRKLNVPLLYLHRYLRITPAYAILIGIFATLLPYAGNGPLWYAVDLESQRCRENWWYNLLYISTIAYPGGSGTCHDTSWYLSNDMVYFLLAPLFVYSLWRWRYMGSALLVLWIAQSTIHTGVLVAQNDFAPTLNYFLPPDDFSTVVYARPWTRSAPYAVGILLGYVLHLRRVNRVGFNHLSTWFVLANWILGAVTCLAVVFGAYDIMNADHPENIYGATATVVYASLHRLAWAIAVAWMIFACVCGYGGWVNGLLSWGPFIPLGKLTFCTYILSTMLMKVNAVINYHPQQYSMYNAVYNFLGQLVFCFLAGFVLMISVEAPFLRLEKLLFEQLRKPKILKPIGNDI